VRRFLAIAVLALAASACTTQEAAPAGPLVLLTHDSFVLSDSVLEQFTEQTGIEIEIVTAGDAGEVVNRAVLTSGDPDADVLFGVDNTLLSRAVDAEVFEPYAAAGLGGVPEQIAGLGAGVVTAVDYGDVCVNIDNNWFRDQGIAVPGSLDDLTEPAYRDLFVTPNPATSSPGLAFLLASISRYGDPDSTEPSARWQQFWQDLADNGLLVVNGWTEAYTGEFTAGGGGGDRPIVLSYATSPPAELVFAADPKPTRPSTSVLDDGCFRQVEFAGVLRGSDRVAQAQQFVDFLLTDTVQADLPLNMFVFPAVSGTTLPTEFEFALQPSEPLTLTPEQIATGRESWVQEWTDIVLR
jgi:thiamine transport system substrate-binding protein